MIAIAHSKLVQGVAGIEDCLSIIAQEGLSQSFESSCIQLLLVVCARDSKLPQAETSVPYVKNGARSELGDSKLKGSVELFVQRQCLPRKAE